MDTRIKFLYLSEPDMIKAGVKNMDQCVEAMEDLLVTLKKGDYVMAGAIIGISCGSTHTNLRFFSTSVMT